MSNPKFDICNDSKLGYSKEMLRLFKRYNRLDEREIFNTTGCMPGCSKSKIELVPVYEEEVMIDNGKKVAQLKITFVYSGGEYDLIEEYYIYNWGSFIADVGGYLGLLLGYSLLSMYHVLTQWFVVAKQWLLNSKSMMLDKN